MSARKHDPVANARSIANTFEWIITAFILAFVFRAFVMEAFRIPTGSMAETLKGDHWRLVCDQCSYKYDYNHSAEFGLTHKNRPILPGPSRCPSCGYYSNEYTKQPVAHGDRILVLKSIYQFQEPKRWDVIVFKNPTNPRENYIKRLIAKPGEKLEIIDGDIYINDQIARKPDKVQDELWMIVYDNDYQPISPNGGRFNSRRWRQPLKNDSRSASKWNIGIETNPYICSLDDSSREHTMYYDINKGSSANVPAATYAYNSPDSYVSRYSDMPFCSDLKVSFYVNISKNDGMAGASLRKYDTVYTAKVLFNENKVVITKRRDGYSRVELLRDNVDIKENSLIQFANVDHQLVLEVDKQKFVYDLGKNASDLGKRINKVDTHVAIHGQGKLELSHIRIYRDTHYLSNGGGVLRAGEGDPFTLGDDQFFACGDNSPASSDSRMWTTKGFGNNGKKYDAGIVPRDYLVGKAFFVYWPDGFRPSKKSNIKPMNWPIIPNIGQMRFIYGG